MATIGLYAILVVLGPGTALALGFDIFRHVKHRPKGRLTGMAFSGGVTLIGDAWSEYVLYYSSGLGISQSQLEVVRNSLNTLSGYLPEYIKVFVPGWLLAFVLVSTVLLAFLSF